MDDLSIQRVEPETCWNLTNLISNDSWLYIVPGNDQVFGDKKECQTSSDWFLLDVCGKMSYQTMSNLSIGIQGRHTSLRHIAFVYSPAAKALQSHRCPETSWIGGYFCNKRKVRIGVIVPQCSSPTVYIPTWIVKSEIKLLLTKKQLNLWLKFSFFFLEAGYCFVSPNTSPPWESRPLPSWWSQSHPQNRIGSGK